jgi:hypothetical protein
MLLYFIKAGDAIKVGIASDIIKRIDGMQTGSSHKIKLLHSIELPSDKARQTEKEIHVFFQKTNLHGEWFRFTQFMFEYIENLKENGLESHLAWLQKRYSVEYEEIVNALKIKIERDLAYGDFVSLEKLKIELNELLDEIMVRQSKPDNVADTVKEWIENRDKFFTIRDIYNYFGFTEKKYKDSARQALYRYVKAGGAEPIQGMRRGVYRKIVQDD